VVRSWRLVDPRTQSVAREIMSYFLDHPEATDSLEGIARWRLMLRQIDRTVEETAVALRVLIKDELIEEVSSQSGPSLYRLNPGKRTEAELIFKGGIRTKGK
jgi:hypothetical protein